MSQKDDRKKAKRKAKRERARQHEIEKRKRKGLGIMMTERHYGESNREINIKAIDAATGEIITRPISKTREGPIRHESLPDDLLKKIKFLYDAVGRYVYDEDYTLEEWEIGFMRDAHPEREIAVWNRIYCAWKAYHLLFLGGQVRNFKYERKLVLALSSISMAGDKNWAWSRWWSNGLKSAGKPPGREKKMAQISKKFKGLANVLWDFEAEGDVLKANIQAIKYLEDVFAKYIPAEILAGWKVKIKVQPVADRSPKKVVLGEVSAEEVFGFLTPDDDKGEREYTIGGETHKVKMSSLRYQVFKRDKCTCVCCGLVGTKMVLERHRHSPRPHFNLYGVEEGRDILFTKDHIIPVAHDGPEHIDNLQTMCTICNVLKGSAKELSLDGLRKMRQVYQENIKLGQAVTSVRLKQMKLGIAEEEAFAQKRAREMNIVIATEKARHPALRFTDNVQVWSVPEGGYIGCPVNMKKVPKKATKVEGVLFRKGTLVKPMRARKDKIHVVFNDDGLYFRVAQALLDYPVEDKNDKTGGSSDKESQ